MPYLIVQDSGRYCVHKENPDGSRGARIACHASERDAEAQRRALYAAETKEAEMNETEVTEETHEKMHYDAVPYTTALDFEELKAEKEAYEVAEDIAETAYYIPTLTQNIINSDEPDKPGRFAQMLDQAKTIVEKVMGKVEEVDDLEPEMEKERHTAFLVTKTQAGDYVWLARYSNNVRDVDNPPEIIAARSHERFVKMVDAGEYPLPELWLWHNKNWKIGQAATVAYDRETGFAIAAGHIDKDKYEIAETLLGLDPMQVKLSHGMPVDSIVRSKEDHTVIIEHQTKEISVLPAWAAANPLTGFVMTAQKENTMIDPQKIQEMKNLGVPADQLQAVEAANQADKAFVDESGAETKEKAAEQETPAEVTETTDQPEVTESETLEPVETVEPEVEPETELTAADVAEVFEEVAKALKTQNDLLTERVTTLENQVKALTATDQEKIEKEIKLTPRESFADRMKSVIGDEATRVDGRTAEGKDGPKETPPEDLKMNSAGITVLSNLPNWREEMQKINQVNQ